VMKDESYRKVKTQAASCVGKWAYSLTDLKLNIPALAKTMSYHSISTQNLYPEEKYQGMKAQTEGGWLTTRPGRFTPL